MDILGMAFKKTFGFRPSRLDGMCDHEQEIVDAKLQTLAETFSYFCRLQQSILEEKPARGDTLQSTERNLLKQARSLGQVNKDVTAAKRNFWRAHKLAEDRGYKVMEKHTSYVPNLLQEIIKNRR